MEQEIKCRREGAKWVIDWPSSAMPSADFREARAFFTKSRDYSPNSAQTFNLSLPHDRAIAVRSVVIKEKIMKNHQRMNAIVGKIAQEYKKKDILFLSEKYDFAPLSLLRAILLHIYPDKKVLIRRAFKGRDRVETKHAEISEARSMFPHRDQAAFTAAESQDA